MNYEKHIGKKIRGFKFDENKMNTKFNQKVDFNFTPTDCDGDPVEENPKQTTIPTHYQTKKGYDVIDIAKDYNLNFNRGSTIKYICRAGKKENEIDDLKKAIEFLSREVEYLERKQ